MKLAQARELAVLSVLKAHPAHGYAISQVFSSGPLSLIGLPRPSVYAILDRFRSRGWVEAAAQGDAGADGAANGRYPDKETLCLTAQGARVFDDMVSFRGGPVAAPVSPLMAFALAVDAGARIDKDVVRALVSEREKRLQDWPLTGHDGTLAETLARGMISAEIDMLKQALRRL